MVVAKLSVNIREKDLQTMSRIPYLQAGGDVRRGILGQFAVGKVADLLLKSYCLSVLSSDMLMHLSLFWKVPIIGSTFDLVTGCFHKPCICDLQSYIVCIHGSVDKGGYWEDINVDQEKAV